MPARLPKNRPQRCRPHFPPFFAERAFLAKQAPSKTPRSPRYPGKEAHEFKKKNRPANTLFPLCHNKKEARAQGKTGKGKPMQSGPGRKAPRLKSKTAAVRDKTAAARNKTCQNKKEETFPEAPEAFSRLFLKRILFLSRGNPALWHELESNQ